MIHVFAILNSPSIEICIPLKDKQTLHGKGVWLSNTTASTPILFIVEFHPFISSDAWPPEPTWQVPRSVKDQVRASDPNCDARGPYQAVLSPTPPTFSVFLIFAQMYVCHMPLYILSEVCRE